MDKEQVIKMLRRYELSDNSIKVYLYLFEFGTHTPLALSKALKISRTQVYRLLEKLEEVLLVSSENLNQGTVYTCEPIANLKTLINSKSLELEKIKTELPLLEQTFDSITSGNALGLNIKRYQGIHGVKHALLNLLKADKEFFVFEPDHLNNQIDSKFAYNFRESYVKKNIVSYDLTNKMEIIPTEILPVTEKNSNVCHISKDVLEIKFEIAIYNDTVTYTNYNMNDLFAVEIQNQAIHDMMFSIYKCFWNLGTPIFGTATKL